VSAVVSVIVLVFLFDLGAVYRTSPWLCLASASYSLTIVPFGWGVWRLVYPHVLSSHAHFVRVACTTVCAGAIQFVRTAFGPPEAITLADPEVMPIRSKVVFLVSYVCLYPVLYVIPLVSHIRLSWRRVEETPKPDAVEGRPNTRVLYPSYQWSAVFWLMVPLLIVTAAVFMALPFGVNFIPLLVTVALPVMAAAVRLDFVSALRVPTPDPGYLLLYWYFIAGVPIGAGHILLVGVETARGDQLLQLTVIVAYHCFMAVAFWLFARITEKAVGRHEDALVLQIAFFLTRELFNELVFFDLEPFSVAYFATMALNLVRTALAVSNTPRRVWKRFQLWRRQQCTANANNKGNPPTHTSRARVSSVSGRVSRGDPAVKAKRLQHEMLEAELQLFCDEVAGVCTLALLAWQLFAVETHLVPTAGFLLEKAGNSTVLLLGSALVLLVVSQHAAGVFVRWLFAARIGRCLAAASSSQAVGDVELESLHGAGTEGGGGKVVAFTNPLACVAAARPVRELHAPGVKLFRAQAASLHRETMRSFWARHWILLLLMLPAVVTPLVDQWFLLVMHEDVPSFSTTPNVTEIITTW